MIDTGSITTLLFAFIALAVVLALAWLLLKGLAALGQRSSASSPMRIKATMPLGSRERLIVLEYSGNEYLVGVASGGISLIDKLPAAKKTPTDTPCT